MPERARPAWRPRSAASAPAAPSCCQGASPTSTWAQRTNRRGDMRDRAGRDLHLGTRDHRHLPHRDQQRRARRPAGGRRSLVEHKTAPPGARSPPARTGNPVACAPRRHQPQPKVTADGSVLLTRPRCRARDGAAARVICRAATCPRPWLLPSPEAGGWSVRGWPRTSEAQRLAADKITG